MKKRDIRLYNVLFPVWMMYFLPAVWVIIIPGNFIIDSVVLLIAMKVLKVEQKKRFYFRHIVPVFFFGFLSDFIGTLPIWIASWFDVDLLGPYADSWLFTVPGVILAGAMIFVFNYLITFRKCEKPLRRKLSLAFAIATAPYTFLIPSRLLYGGF